MTRPTIISKLIAVVREECEKICDKDTLEELLTIVRNEKGRIEAPLGGHDDQMMGLAIAHEIREQVVFNEPSIHMKQKQYFNIEAMLEPRYDEGEQIVVI